MKLSPEAILERALERADRFHFDHADRYFLIGLLFGGGLSGIALLETKSVRLVPIIICVVLVLTAALVFVKAERKRRDRATERVNKIRLMVESGLPIRREKSRRKKDASQGAATFVVRLTDRAEGFECRIHATGLEAEAIGAYLLAKRQEDLEGAVDHGAILDKLRALREPAQG